ncbi:MAG: hypothetical protein Q7T57_05850, partial [Dehalococcoidales bacterium]|nr:hypothetical protein [Dehalococcoidales bacterium]
MPKRGANQQASDGSNWDWFFYAIVVLAIIDAIVIIPWSDIVNWLSDIAQNIWTLFFWGLFLVIFAVLTPIFLIWRRRLTLFLKYWYRWLGTIALT